MKTKRLSFDKLKEKISKNKKIKDEYKQVMIVILRGIFKEEGEK